jgi:hypothetical protein
MKKIQAKKKRDRAEADAEENAPQNGQVVKNILDNDDDLPVLFT